jgi:hypothetical protein
MINGVTVSRTAFDALDERAAERQPVRLALHAASAIHSQFLVTMLNISTHGSLVCTETPLLTGSFVTLIIKEPMIYGAWVVWRKCGFAGLSFANQLPQALVDYLVVGI